MNKGKMRVINKKIKKNKLILKKKNGFQEIKKNSGIKKSGDIHYFLKI
jgi:hypothetical protein